MSHATPYVAIAPTSGHDAGSWSRIPPARIGTTATSGIPMPTATRAHRRIGSSPARVAPQRKQAGPDERHESRERQDGRRPRRDDGRREQPAGDDEAAAEGDPPSPQVDP